MWQQRTWFNLGKHVEICFKVLVVMDIVCLFLQAKRVEKHLRKHHNGKGGVAYSTGDGPFEEVVHTERFVWGKKIEKQLESGMDVAELTARAERRRQKERMEEIEKVRKRREQREAEREALAAEMERMQREKAMEEALDEDLKEEEFHLQQAQVRARQRLSEGRPKAIDLVTNNLFLLDGFDPTEEDPGTIIDSLNLYQLRDLEKDIAEYWELDARNASHSPFWKALSKVAAARLTDMTREEEIDRAKVKGLPPPKKYTVREAGWHESLDADVALMFSGKTAGQLEDLEAGIRQQLDLGEVADPEYWEAVLRRLDIAKARALLREFHADLMERHLSKLRAGVDMPRSLTSGKDRSAQAKLEAERAEAESMAAMARIEETEEDTKVREGTIEAAERPMEATNVQDEELADRNKEEIELSDEEDGVVPAQAMEEAEQRTSGMKPTDDHEGLVQNRKMDDETQELKRPLGLMPPPETRRTGKEIELPKAPTDEQVARGEPRSWDDLSHEERVSSMRASEDWSPLPIPVEHTLGHQIIPEEEDSRMICLLRERVKLKAREQFRAAAARAKESQGGSSTFSAATEQLYRKVVVNPKAADTIMRSGNPLFRQAAAQDAKMQINATIIGSGMNIGVQNQDVALNDDDRRFQAVAEKSMGDLGTSGDAPFGGEVGLESQVYWWHEKYRPRKPKYFNRVHTGYDWNKYNKAHYDSDNPPPKVVQGYKFNSKFTANSTRYASRSGCTYKQYNVCVRILHSPCAPLYLTHQTMDR